MDMESKGTQAVEDIPEVDDGVCNGPTSCEDTETYKEPTHQHSPRHHEPEETGTCDNDQPDTSGDTPVSVDVSVVPPSNTDDVSAIDRSARQNAIDSDKDYRRITEKIIDKTCDQLNAHTNAKSPLREKLSNFIVGLLSVQFLVLVVILFFNSEWKLQISDFILNSYIISVFVETLAGLTIMIKFAFDSKQEVELIQILNAIITNFKKYDEK